uniref:C-type lectin domain family 2 member B-like isoform X1 n=1 Tax=Pogona vitticeps TaxID=103695 RepID=A0ABM5FIL5_9SAUR
MGFGEKDVMDLKGTEKKEESFPLDSHAVENGAVTENTAGSKAKAGATWIHPAYVLGSCILNILLIIVIIVLLALLALWKRRQPPSPANPVVLVLSCPDGWVGYRRRCYYFADEEKDWESSKNNCSVFNASLAVVDSQEEMDFLARYKTSDDHWIGLQRDSEGQPWRWTNGTPFNNWFQVRGGAECAYISENAFASSSCTRTERWICSRQIEK